MSSRFAPNSYWRLHAVPGGFNIEKIDLVNLVFVNHDGQLRGVLESHFADSERPQHYLQEILVGDVFVSLDPRYSRTEDRGRYALLGVDVVYLVPEIDEKLKVLRHCQQRLVVLVELGERGQEVVLVQADCAYLISFLLSMLPAASLSITLVVLSEETALNVSSMISSSVEAFDSTPPVNG